MKKQKKILVAALSLVLVALCAVGGTLAWLTDKTDTVTNTFTVGKVDITLYESKWDGTNLNNAQSTTSNSYKMVPGTTYGKDPTITVDKDSEDCWVFVKIEEENNEAADAIKFYNYAIDTQWHALDAEKYPGVYVINEPVQDHTADKSINVLQNKQVTVSGDVTTGMLEKAETNAPTLKFTAYAVQLKNGNTTFSQKDAWDIVKP